MPAPDHPAAEVAGDDLAHRHGVAQRQQPERHGDGRTPPLPQPSVDGERRQRPEKYLWTEHAERNAFYNAARIGVSLKNGTLYVNRVPCPDCARGVVQAGISQVVTTVGTDEAQFAERLNTVWSMELFRETGIPVTLYGPEVHKRLSRFRFESDR